MNAASGSFVMAPHAVDFLGENYGDPFTLARSKLQMTVPINTRIRVAIAVTWCLAPMPKPEPEAEPARVQPPTMD